MSGLCDWPYRYVRNLLHERNRPVSIIPRRASQANWESSPFIRRFRELAPVVRTVGL
jgi:hypothetical protein